MATRPIYIPLSSPSPGAEEKNIDFQWYPGMALVQKQKSISAMHSVAKERGIYPVLEISSKSPDELGVQLSAFNLLITTKIQKKKFSVETAFQGSKVFERGGPFTELLDSTSREAKKDPRIRSSGNLIKFTFYGQDFPSQPRTFFYDWLYVNALKQNEELSSNLLTFNGFTDIEFNPKKSINCQAYSAALYVSLVKTFNLEKALQSPKTFLEILDNSYRIKAGRTFVQTKMI